MKSRFHFFIAVILVLASLAACHAKPGLPASSSISLTATLTPPAATATVALTPAFWIPPANAVFQIQLTDYPPDLEVEAGIYELDLFETTENTIAHLQQQGKKVVCYFNAGAREDFRPDARDFPGELIGEAYIGWPGENWLDVGNYEKFAKIILARLDLAKEKGCDGVDPDNINGYQQNTGFDISADDQLAYNIWLSDQAHARGLAIALKNNNTQVNELVKYFDFAVIEDCTRYDECALYYRFKEEGKAVFQIEYTDRFDQILDICAGSLLQGYSLLLKNSNLDAFVRYCE